ncbi:MAG: hypothetical protein B6U65_02940 [Candidatus Wolframiiraptor sp. EX4484-121]|nr:MAG: hypothetical protein B6U65_02940 [Candidatus Wolframiiraptor sp. EX4484-121]
MVYIRRLTIQGFKSFGPRRISITLEKGLTVITGPNGGGKSNVMDAIRFALGELSAHNLRVGRMAELIHDDPRTNYARVSITLDNSEGVLPVNSPEVTVARRIDRSGESTYFLNGRQVSRNELLTILSMANIKPSGFNIVPQGSVIEIAEMGGGELRKMIEDISGISDYERKREEAEEQLAIAEKNLAIAKASTGEVRLRVRQLQRERNQAYRRIHAERFLNSIKSLEFKRGIARMEPELSSIDRELMELEEELNELNSKRMRILDEKRDLEERWEEDSRKLQEIEAKIDELKRERERIASEIGRLNTSISVMNERIRRISDERSYIEERLKNVDRRMAAIMDEIKRSRESLEILVTEFSKVRELEGQKREELKQAEEELGRKTSDLDRRKRAAQRKLRTLEAEIAEAQAEVEQLKRFVKDSERELNQLSDRSSKNMFKVSDCLKRLYDIDESIESIEEGLGKSRLRFEENLSRLKTARKLEAELNEALKRASLSGLIKGVETRKALLEEIRSAGVNGIYGFLDDVIEADEKVFEMLEAATGGWIHALVVQDLNLALRLAEVLTESGISLKLLPLDVAEGCGGSRALKSMKLKFRFDWAEKALAYLLRGVRFDLGVKIPGIGEKVVSPSLVIHPDLRIEVNPGRRTLLENLLTREYLRSIEILEQVREEITKLENETRKLEDLIQNYEKRLVNLEAERERLAQEAWMEYVSASEAILREVEVDSRIKRMKTEILGAERRRADAEETIERLRMDELEREEEAIERLKEEVSSLRTEYEEVKMKAAEVEAVLTETRKNLERLEDSKRKLSEEKIELEKRIQKLDHESRNALMENEKNTEILKRLKEELEKKSAQLSELTELSESLSEKISGYSLKLREHARELDEIGVKYQDLSSRMASLRVRRAQLEAELSRLREGLKELGDRETNLPEFDQELLGKILAGLEEELKELEMINQLAPAQYEELVQNYKLRSTRISELEEEREKIIKFIEWIEGEKRRVFLETFDKVADAFEIFFNRLTGGQGWLRLENPNNPFSGGVEMILRFPGKPARSVRAASGGEKSVAAVALLLALQGLTPADFYIFDEIDAHMDLQYSRRLAELFQEMAEKTQIIVISLKDVMAERADQLIGVYNRGGESRVVKLELEEVVKAG